MASPSHFIILFDSERVDSGRGYLRRGRTDVNNQNGDNLIFNNLKPVCTRLNITLSKKSTYTGPGEWTKLVLSGANLYQRGTYNPLPDNVTAQSGAGYTQTFASPKSIDGGTIDLRLLPVASLTQDLTVAMTVDGKEMSVTVPKEKFNGTKMERGVSYTLAIMVSTVGISVQSLEYTQWENVSTETPGNASQTGEMKTNIRKKDNRMKTKNIVYACGMPQYWQAASAYWSPVIRTWLSMPARLKWILPVR